MSLTLEQINLAICEIVSDKKALNGKKLYVTYGKKKKDRIKDQRLIDGEFIVPFPYIDIKSNDTARIYISGMAGSPWSSDVSHGELADEVTSRLICAREDKIQPLACASACHCVFVGEKRHHTVQRTVRKILLLAFVVCGWSRHPSGSAGGVQAGLF
jgi:hypothetical protein